MAETFAVVYDSRHAKRRQERGTRITRNFHSSNSSPKFKANGIGFSHRSLIE